MHRYKSHLWHWAKVSSMTKCP